jgi:hypothetical protein
LSCRRFIVRQFAGDWLRLLTAGLAIGNFPLLLGGLGKSSICAEPQAAQDATKEQAVGL